MMSPRRTISVTMSTLDAEYCFCVNMICTREPLASAAAAAAASGDTGAAEADGVGDAINWAALLRSRRPHSTSKNMSLEEASRRA